MLFSRKFNNYDKYIFFIGFNKTGTTSLHRLFKEYGIASAHWKNGKLAKQMLVNCLSNRKILRGFDGSYRVFSDMYFRNEKIYFEANSLFKQLDHDYPKSLFIYNTRPIENWLVSRARHKSGDGTKTFIDFYKRYINSESDLDVMNLWRHTRIEFEKNIFSYFKGRDNFMELDIEQDDVIAKLNSFANLAFPDSAWMKHNETGRQKS